MGKDFMKLGKTYRVFMKLILIYWRPF